jgi:high-affinity nickel-transport protein
MKINPHCLSCAFLPGMLTPSIYSAVLAAIASEGLPHIFSSQKLGTFLFVAGLGLVLGMRHSTDADHVVAISTIVSRQRGLRGAALIGSLWGLGHTVTIFIVGCLIILGGIVIPPRIGLSMEFCVALMLILLGVLNLTGVMARIVARLTPTRPQDPVHHLPPGRVQSTVSQHGFYHLLRPLVVGLVHGLAGSAAIALLVLSTIHSPFWAVLYLIIFGVGTMLGMMCMTAAMSVPMTYAGDRLPVVSRYLGVASGLVSVCFGSFLVYQLGYVGGLFTSHPHWTPQ